MTIPTGPGERGDKTFPHLVCIADVNGPGLFHLGDEAMWEANLLALRHLIPEARFTILSGDPEWSSRRYGVQSLRTPQISPARLTASGMDSLAEGLESQPPHQDLLGPDITEALQTADGLIVSGAGNLCAAWPEKIVLCAALLHAARHFRVPAVVLTQTIGPQLTGAQRRLLAASLPHASWIGVREETSRSIVQSLHISPERLHQHLDDAYFLEPVPLPQNLASRLDRLPRPWVIVTLDASFTSRERRREIPALALQLRSLGRSIGGSLLFVPHVSGTQADASFADAEAGNLLAKELQQDLTLLEPLEPRAFRELVSQAALVISTRYHSVVFAMASGVPCLAISTDAYTKVKLKGALRYANLEGWCIPVEEAAAGALLPLARELFHQTESVSSRLQTLRTRLASVETQRWQSICRALGLEPQYPFTVSTSRPALSRVPELVTETRYSESECRTYEELGYCRLRNILSPRQLLDIQVRYTGDATAHAARPEHLPGIESDHLIWELFRHPAFREIAAWHYGPAASISLLPVTLSSNVASPSWNQGGAGAWHLDREPAFTVCVALDSATNYGGSLQVVPGSHRMGFLGKQGGEPGAEEVEEYCRVQGGTDIELEAGDALVLHNNLFRRASARPAPRLLCSSYLDARTLNAGNGNRFPIIFGYPPDNDAVLPFLRDLRGEMDALRQRLAESQGYSVSLLKQMGELEMMRREAERYAISLLEDNKTREQMRLEAEAYARSLEARIQEARINTDTPGNDSE